jgi:indole-3-glycerol phosphate synthase
MNYLDKILAHKKQEIKQLDKSELIKLAEQAILARPNCIDFYQALKRSGKDQPLNLIAELKKASPSRGVLIKDFKPLELAGAYHSLGASAFSILTDEQFFQGSCRYVEDVRSHFHLPILRKDFIIDESQVYEARIIGADAILLIVAALSPQKLTMLHQLANKLGMSVLVEIHSKDELAIAVDSGSKIIGVNNRDLTSFEVSLHNSCRLKPYFPDGVIAVSESGIKSQQDLALLSEHNFDAVLIGEGLISKELHSYLWKNNQT